MIRINLLRRERRPDRRAKRVAGEPAQSNILQQLSFVALVAVVAALCGWLWLDTEGKKTRLNDEKRRLTDEKESLKGIRQKVNELQAKQQRAENLRQLLTDLQVNQRTPLYALYYLYKAQVENKDAIYTEIRQRDPRGLQINVKGEADTDQSFQNIFDTLANYTDIVNRVRFIKRNNIGGDRVAFEFEVFFKRQSDFLGGGSEEDEDAGGGQ